MARQGEAASCAVAGDVSCPLVRAPGGTALRRRADEARRLYREDAGDEPDDCVILALDPGGTTGWAILVIAADAFRDPETKILSSVSLYTYGQIGEGGIPWAAPTTEWDTRPTRGAAGARALADGRDPDAPDGGEYRAEHEQIAAITDMVDAWPTAAVIREDFILRTQNKSRDTLSPVRLGFGIDHLLWERGRWSFTQQPSMAKGTATDARLKEWGLYRPGGEHARDATRHAITFARRVKGSPMLLRRAFPHLGRA